jgi:hypothetical protein
MNCEEHSLFQHVLHQASLTVAHRIEESGQGSYV